MALPACVKRYSDTARHKTLPRIPPPVGFYRRKRRGSDRKGTGIK
ncbi:hypothetical protein T556_11945 [Neisseria gonorrhoeae NG-k51.05]|nr:hypothetical protein T556_11945 [Neisseria gonorrhoeae NG-k51.05]